MTKKTDINRIPEWENEPDYEEFTHKGYKCSIKRNMSGALCGYVDLPKDHPWYELGYDDIEIDVHGGLTYAQNNVSEQGEESYTIGFDCSHAFDYCPYTYGMTRSIWYKNLTDEEKKIFDDYNAKRQDLFSSMPSQDGSTYKNIEYVREECRSMVEQAIVAESNLK